MSSENIQMLSSILGLELQEVKSKSEIFSSRSKGSFLLNGEDQIVGLNLWDSNIKKLDFLAKLPDLRYLGLGLNWDCNFAGLSRMTNLEELSLSHNDIEDPGFLSGLTNLKVLSLEGNKIADLSFVKDLFALESLSLNGNQVKDGKYLSDKSGLNSLELRDNRLSDHRFLTSLTRLALLDLGGNDITKFDFLTDFRELTVLYLSRTNLTDISFLYNLPNLLTLELSGVRNLSFGFLSEFTNLLFLYLNDTNLSDCGFLESLTNMLGVELNANRISDISFMRGWKDLARICIANNQVSDLSVLEGLDNLTKADLTGNQITDIRPLLKFVKKGLRVVNKDWDYDSFCVAGNPIESTLLKMLDLGGDAVLRHFERISEEGLDYIFEAKITLVGEGGTGKTSLQARLLNENAALPKDDTRTRGIQISDWHFDDSDGRKTAHIWDFGGQDVYYPVHRFFLTENSVFILLASTRNASHNFEYWIPTIFQFGGNSPIILGQTCHDGLRVTWNDIGNYLANTNFNIVRTGSTPYFQLNLPDRNDGLKEIRSAIVAQIAQLSHFGRGVPRSWIPVRIAIADEAKKNACISFDRFTEICRQINADKFADVQQVEDIGNFLHFLGIIVWYSNNEELREWVVLQPGWIMNAVYRIIDDVELQNRHGLILPADFERLWSDGFYKGRQNVLKKMLQVFKIIFPQKTKKNTFILPARLLSIPKESIWPRDGVSLRLQYDYVFMPRGLVNQLSAELSRLIVSDNDVWNNAVTLTYGDGTARAQVFEDFYHRQICVAASGADARGLIMLIMNEMTNIIDGYKGVEADLSVPCNCPVCLTSETPIFFKHKELLRWSKRGTVFCNESGTSMSINELLFNVGLINPLKETTRSETTSARPLKAFISYSRLDGESREEGGYDYLSQFKKHLAPLAKYSELIQTWDDTLLIAGEDWDDRIRDELQKSDVIFLLISVNFLNTPYIADTELRIAIGRHERKECLVVPVVIGACGWQDIKWLGKIAAVPRKGANIASWEANPAWKTIDDAWMHVYNEVKEMIVSYQKNKA